MAVAPPHGQNDLSPLVRAAQSGDRGALSALITQIEPDIRRLVFIDETGATISMSRQYAWAPRGTRAEDAIPRNRGTVTTIFGALTVDGLTAVMTLEGGTTRAWPPACLPT